jgi:hypothetical protein
VLFYPQALLAVRDRLQDVHFEPSGGAFASAPRWWIAPGDRTGR